MYIACGQKITFLFHCWSFEGTLRGALKQSNILNSGWSRPLDKGGGGWGAGHPDPEIRGGGAVSKKIFFGPSFGLKRRGGGPPGPLPWVRHCSTITLKSDQENDHGHLQEKFGTGGSLPRTFSLLWPHHHHPHLYTKSYHFYMVFLGIVSWESMLIYWNKRRRLTVAFWRVRAILTLTPCDKSPTGGY